jgi:predicted nucleic acid-binding protein
LAACRDPDDDKFLELAVNGNADVIVSGDADLLALDTFPRHPDHHGGGLRARVR